MNWAHETESARRERLGEWHRWFAWYPVRIGQRIYWLETVMRKCKWIYWVYEEREYKPIIKTKLEGGKP